MKNLAVSRRIVVGEINILPGDRTANDALRRAAEFNAIPVYTYPADYWEGMDPNKRLQRLTEWLIEIGANTVVTSAQRSAKQAHHTVGRLATQAAITMATETRESMTVLEGHNINGRQGRWIPVTDNHDSLVAPRHMDAPNMDTTYTRHLIDPIGMLATGSAELLIATGEI